MPYKDPEKQKTAMRKVAQRRRERQKERLSKIKMTFQDSLKQSGNNFMFILEELIERAKEVKTDRDYWEGYATGVKDAMQLLGLTRE